MSREIKFRIFDTQTNKMHEVDILKIGFASSAYSYPQDKDDCVGVGTEDSNRILMQYTGLKDKNGKDIYEGDILQFKNDLGRNSKVKIFYKPGGLCYNAHNNDFTKSVDDIIFHESCADMQSKGWITQFEVIGNIHQNPELIK